MYFREYLKAQFKDTVSLMSGIASLVLVAFGQAIPTTAVKKSPFWIAAALCFMWSSYRIWAKERGKNKRPKIEGEIRDFVILPYRAPFKRVGSTNITPGDIVGLVVDLAIRMVNVNSTRSSVTNFAFALKTANGIRASMLSEEGQISQSVWPGILGASKEFTNLAGFTGMLIQGKNVYGCLRFRFPGLTEADTETISIATLGITDHKGTPHAIPCGYPCSSGFKFRS